MNSRLFHTRLDLFARALCALIAMATCLIFSQPSYAQQNQEEELPRLKRVVVMEVPQGGTRHLRAAVGALGELEVHNENWFMRQVESRAFRFNGILDRPSDLKWVMNGASIDVIIRLFDDADIYEVQFITAAQADIEDFFEVPLSDRGLSRDTANEIAQRLAPYIGFDTAQAPSPQQQAPAPVAEQPAQPEPEPRPQAPAAEPEPAPQQQASAPVAEQPAQPAPQAEAPAPVAEPAPRGPRPPRDASQYDTPNAWLQIDAGFDMLKKDWGVSGTNAILSYRSVAYPGYSLNIEAYPFDLMDEASPLPGIYVNYQHGFDSYPLEVETSSTTEEGEEIIDVETQELSISTMTIEGGLVYRLGPTLPLSPMSKWRLKAGARFDSFGVTDNDILPSTTITSIVLGAKMAQPILAEGLLLNAGVDIIPLAFFGKNADLFGTESSAYGFGSDIGLSYHFSSALGVSLGYGFQVTRAVFEGTSASDFIDTDSYDLRQGFNLGITFRQ